MLTTSESSSADIGGSDDDPGESAGSQDSKPPHSTDRRASTSAVVSEVDGEVTLGKIKRGNREVIVTSRNGDVRKIFGASVTSNSCSRE